MKISILVARSDEDSDIFHVHGASVGVDTWRPGYTSVTGVWLNGAHAGKSRAVHFPTARVLRIIEEQTSEAVPS